MSKERIVMPVKHICLVEDEADLNQMLTLYLERANYTVCPCATLAEAQKYLKETIDLWVIDVMLPDGNGLELLKQIKRIDEKTAVVIISAKGDRFDRVAGFEVGCDDYIAKPFLPAELVFRVDRLFRQMRAAEHKDEILSIGPYSIDSAKRIVFEGSQRIDITSRELDVILFFIQHKGQAISRDLLLNSVWGMDYFGNDRIVDNYVKNIRKKLPAFSIETIYGYGYRYNL